MATEIVLMPDVDGAGDIVEYCIQLGDEVSAGDPIVVIESDKASMEVPSSVKGVVTEWLVQMGDSVVKDHPLAKIEVSEEASAKDGGEVLTAPVITNGENHVQSTPAVIKGAATDETVRMPDAGGQGDIIEFYVKPGDCFVEGEALVLVESDKAAMDVPAPFSGKVIELIATLGQTVEEGVALLCVSRASEIADKDKPVRAATAEPERSIVAEMIQAVPTVQVTQDMVVAEMSRSVPARADVTYAGPATRKLARELAVDLAGVKGSGPRGRILKEDVKGFVKQQMSKVTDSAIVETGIPTLPVEDFSRFGSIKMMELSGIAKATSAHMTRCWLNIPHVTLLDEVDISELESFRATIKPDLYGLDKKPTMLPFIIMVIAKALRKYPQFNSSLHPDGKQLIYKDYVNIGVAVDTPAGLVVPVIRDVDKKSVCELMQEVNELAVKAKARKLKVEDMQGGCFTISSLGATGGTGFTPIVNGPEVAILGVARAEMKPVWNGHEFLPRKKIPLCLSFDHRVINGVAAGRFMAMVHQCLSQVGNILL